MEAEQSSHQCLPDELVSKIIAMVPFPSIFKARTLSKTWLVRFSPIKTLDEEGLQKQVDAASFQKQVLDRSADWPIFFPLQLGKSHSWAYNLADHTWQSLPSLSFLPKSVWYHWFETITSGALLFLYHSWSTEREKLYMANIFTRSWKVLPPRPNIPETFRYEEHIVTNPSTQTYKLIILFRELRLQNGAIGYYLQTYDSKSNAWSSSKVCRTANFGGKAEHPNGDVMYRIEGWRNLVALDCKEGTLDELLLSGPISDRITFSSQQVMVCNSSLVTVMIDPSSSRKLMKVDLGSGRLLEIVGGPTLDFNPDMSSSSQRPVGHGDCIYFGSVGSSCQALAYNLPKNEWSYFDLSPSPSLSLSNNAWKYISQPCVFQPGMNVFMPV